MEMFNNPWFIAFWITCGVFEHGINMGYARSQYPNVFSDSYRLIFIIFIIFIISIISIISALLGPFTLATSLVRGDYKYGWRLT